MRMDPRRGAMPPGPAANALQNRPFSAGPLVEQAPRIGPKPWQYQDSPGQQEFYSHENFLPLGQGTRTLQDDVERGRPLREQREAQQAQSQQNTARDFEQMQVQTQEDTEDWSNTMHTAPFAFGDEILDKNFTPPRPLPPPLQVHGPRQARQVNVPSNFGSIMRSRSAAPSSQSRRTDGNERMLHSSDAPSIDQNSMLTDYDRSGQEQMSTATIEVAEIAQEERTERDASATREKRLARTQTPPTQQVSVTPAVPKDASRSASDSEITFPPGTVLVAYTPIENGTTAQSMPSARIRISGATNVKGQMLALDPTPAVNLVRSPVRPVRSAPIPREEYNPPLRPYLASDLAPTMSTLTPFPLDPMLPLPSLTLTEQDLMNFPNDLGGEHPFGMGTGWDMGATGLTAGLEGIQVADLSDLLPTPSENRDDAETVVSFGEDEDDEMTVDTGVSMSPPKRSST
jgi:hypothetical protein